MKKCLLLLPLFSLFCSSSLKNIEQLPQTLDIEYTLSDIIKTDEQLGQNKTYVIFFNLQNDIPQMYLKILQVSKMGTNNERNLATFIALDKKIHISNQDIYAEIFKNYNSNWEIVSDGKITTKNDEPLCRLTKGLYRIRFIVTDNNTENIAVVYNSNLKASFSLNDETFAEIMEVKEK